MAKKDRIILGSGHTYVMEFTGTIPEDSVIETAENMIGATSGGASLEYSIDKYTAKSDDGTRSKTIITDEEAILKTGIMTFSPEKLAQLIATGKVSESTGKRTIKIGGKNNDNGKSYLVRFVHDDKEDGYVKITMVGKNTAGLTFTFTKDKETVTDAEFTAEPKMDEQGTLIQMDFQDDTIL